MIKEILLKIILASKYYFNIYFCCKIEFLAPGTNKFSRIFSIISCDFRSFAKPDATNLSPVSEPPSGYLSVPWSKLQADPGTPLQYIWFSSVPGIGIIILRSFKDKQGRLSFFLTQIILYS